MEEGKISVKLFTSIARCWWPTLQPVITWIRWLRFANRRMISLNRRVMPLVNEGKLSAKSKIRNGSAVSSSREPFDEANRIKQIELDWQIEDRLPSDFETSTSIKDQLMKNRLIDFNHRQGRRTTTTSYFSCLSVSALDRAGWRDRIERRYLTGITLIDMRRARLHYVWWKIGRGELRGWRRSRWGH